MGKLITLLKKNEWLVKWIAAVVLIIIAWSWIAGREYQSVKQDIQQQSQAVQQQGQRITSNDLDHKAIREEIRQDLGEIRRDVKDVASKADTAIAKIEDVKEMLRAQGYGAGRSGYAKGGEMANTLP